MKPKLSLVTLGVADVARSSAFYRALGWPTIASSDEATIVFFQLDGMVLGLFGHRDLAGDVGLPHNENGGFRAITLAHNEPSADEVDKAYAEFIAAGASAIKKPQPTEWGGYSGYVADPDGHVWEVAFNPIDDWT
jgi:uncharacterized protein